MVISQYIVGAIGVTSGKTADTPSGQASVRAMIAFICLNISAFAMTWGPSAWIVVGEIFPLPIRARGVGLSTASNWFWNCIIAVITPCEHIPFRAPEEIFQSLRPLFRREHCYSRLSRPCWYRKRRRQPRRKSLLPLGLPLHPRCLLHILLRSGDEGSVFGAGRQDVGGDVCEEERQMEATFDLRI